MNKLISHNSKSSGNLKMRQLLKNQPLLLEEISDAAIFNNIAFELLTLRRSSGLTQKELAEKIDLQQSHISRWERAGYQGYKVKVLSKLARTLGGSLQITLLPPKSNLTITVTYTHKESIENLDGSSTIRTRTQSDSVTYNAPRGAHYATN